MLIPEKIYHYWGIFFKNAHELVGKYRPPEPKRESTSKRSSMAHALILAVTGNKIFCLNFYFRCGINIVVVM